MNVQQMLLRFPVDAIGFAAEFQVWKQRTDDRDG
jgi:hypothetical protein